MRSVHAAAEDQCRDPIGGVRLHRRDYVAVHVEGDADRGVTETLLDDLRVHPEPEAPGSPTCAAGRGPTAAGVRAGRPAHRTSARSVRGAAAGHRGGRTRGRGRRTRRRGAAAPGPAPHGRSAGPRPCWGRARSDRRPLAVLGSDQTGSSPSRSTSVRVIDMRRASRSRDAQVRPSASPLRTPVVASNSHATQCGCPRETSRKWPSSCRVHVRICSWRVADALAFGTSRSPGGVASDELAAHRSLQALANDGCQVGDRPRGEALTTQVVSPTADQKPGIQRRELGRLDRLHWSGAESH